MISLDFAQRRENEEKEKKINAQGIFTYMHTYLHVHTYIHTYIQIYIISIPHIYTSSNLQPHKHKTRITVGTISCRTRLSVCENTTLSTLPSLPTLSAGSYRDNLQSEPSAVFPPTPLRFSAFPLSRPLAADNPHCFSIIGRKWPQMLSQCCPNSVPILSTRLHPSNS